MKRTAWKWSVFCAALVLVLTVMAYLTVRMLQFEHAVAMADARAATEETVRLALWRMDSTAAVLLAEKPTPGQWANNNLNLRNDVSSQQTPFRQQRSDPDVQMNLSIQEYQQRVALAPSTRFNWRRIEPVLLDRISDILPGARLEAVAPAAAGVDDTRRLASIPARLVVPAAAFAPPTLPWNTPLRVSLMIAWVCALIAAAAVALLMGGALALSERRGDFVSAVTHELRTPLTTFRMYAEMLAGGMVVDPEARQQYLDTLVFESDRLGRLIENVLAYARLERQLTPAQADPVTLAELLDRVLPTLRRRAQQDGLELLDRVDDALLPLALRTDGIAVQQILLNLVDNACKYGKTAVSLSAVRSGAALVFRVEDGGPGLTPAVQKRLFTAFSKTRNDAVPGIGLGLFLSRRLARTLGGELAQVPTSKGAAFELRLPLARNDAGIGL